MSIERIPCGGWDIDTTTLQFQNKVLKAVGGITGAYLPLSGGKMGADAMIQGTDNLEIVVGDNSVESSVVGVTQNGVTIEHNTNSNIDSSLRIIENTIELTADNNTITLNGTGVDLNGTNVTGVGSLTDVDGAEIVIETTLDMNNHNIINVDTPVNPDDVANKQYVDNKAPALATVDVAGIVKQIPNIEQFTNPSSATAQEIADKFNNLIQNLINAGIMVAGT